MKSSSSLRSKYAFVKGNFLLLTITWVLIYFASPIPQTYSSLYYLDLGANDFLLGVIGFAGSIALALVQFPGGYLADKHGRRWLIFTMTYGLAFTTLFFVFAPSWEFIALGLMLQNLCLIYQPALFAIMIDSIPPESRGTGFTLELVINNLVSLPGPIIAGYLVLTFDLNLGVRIAYVIAMMTYFVAAMLRVKLKETLKLNGNATRPDFLDALRQYPKSVRESLHVWSEVPRSVFYLFIATTGISSLVVGCQTYFLVYASDVLKIEKFQWALIMAFMYLSTTLPAIWAGLRMDAVGCKRFLVLGYLLYVPAMLIFINADFYMLLLAFFFFGLGQVLTWSSYQSLLGDLTPRNSRGKVVGCSQFFVYLSQAFTQLFVGALYAYVSPQLPFILLAIATIPSVILILLKVSEPKVKEV